jgi:hypothetical protein
MYTAERQRAQPYLEQASGPLFEQWYFLHHRIVRVVTNQRRIADDVRRFLYYAEFMAEQTYERPTDLPVNIPEDLMWQAGEQLHYPVALTCYLFETQPGEAFPPAPAREKPGDVAWEEISGIDGVMRARWKEDLLRFREYQAYPGVCSRICSVLHKKDFYASIFIEHVAECQPWFIPRFVFYMVVGAMYNYSGYEVVHTAAVALERQGIMIAGSPGSGKSTLVLSCLQAGMGLLGDDVLFLDKEEGEVYIYAFPEDIGVRKGTTKLLSSYDFVQNLPEDERQKRPIDVQRFFSKQVVTSCPVRLMLFLHAENRQETFKAEALPPAQAVALLMQEYITQQQAKEGEADHMFGIFGDLAAQVPAYRLWLTPDTKDNAAQVRFLLMQHLPGVS